PRFGPFAWHRYDRNPADAWRRRSVGVARRATSSLPGVAAELWPLYRATSGDDVLADHRGIATQRLRAEHHAIGLWSSHQQGERNPVHQRGATFGAACRRLFDELNSDRDLSPADTGGDDYVSRR